MVGRGLSSNLSGHAVRAEVFEDIVVWADVIGNNGHIFYAYSWSVAELCHCSYAHRYTRRQIWNSVSRHRTRSTRGLLCGRRKQIFASGRNAFLEKAKHHRLQDVEQSDDVQNGNGEFPDRHRIRKLHVKLGKVFWEQRKGADSRPHRRQPQYLSWVVRR